MVEVAGVHTVVWVIVNEPVSSLQAACGTEQVSAPGIGPIGVLILVIHSWMVKPSVALTCRASPFVCQADEPHAHEPPVTDQVPDHLSVMVT